ncbi:hypothetical protein [Vitiosangium sp. GDMCC 1.1324]|uniref:hypothetical protein n=1 Tax=Vitiosangium sp. (strain GDMCC 1.1324) TaxID=2138576 RepID=UPI000D375A67|nr:hypothetical protein [Vitiosangium sp. GDMCC 1.1324]PTL80886.1 hypothetical protein DAT35_26505 [Vitiosangium sp. GDMCC 1.1324]
MKHTPALILLALCACGSREEGIRLHLELELHAARGAQVEGSVRQFTNDRGDHITLTRAHVTLSSVEIFPCQTSSAWRWLRMLSPIGTAEAHEAGSPRRLGTPHVSALELSDGEPLELGTLQPPPGSYCRARLVFAPADADAEGLTAGMDMEGKTLLLEGQLLPSSGGPARTFRVESANLANAELWLEGLSLSEDALEASRTIHLAYDRWLDGVDPTSEGAAEQVLHNVASSATIGP